MGERSFWEIGWLAKNGCRSAQHAGGDGGTENIGED
jgi:hypothetical protein